MDAWEFRKRYWAAREQLAPCMTEATIFGDVTREVCEVLDSVLTQLDREGFNQPRPKCED